MEIDNCATSPKPMNNGEPQDDGNDFLNESPRREDSIAHINDERIEEVAEEEKILEPLHIADCDEISSEVTKQPKTSKGTLIKRSKKAIPIISSNDQRKRTSSQVEGSRVSGNLGTIRTRKKPQRKKETNLVSNNKGNVGKRIDKSPKPLTLAAPLTCAEYAQCLGLQPAVKFKCHNCGETNFASIGMLREHQADCSGVIDNRSEEAESCATFATSGSNLLITQQLILCSACDIYFDSFHSLFLHMQSVHRRHICLFCLKVFSRAERLASHIVSTHGASEASHPSADAFRSSRQSPCLLLCCTCERIFSDGDEFFDHSCRSGGLTESSSDDIGRSLGGDGGSGRNESSNGGKCSGSGGPDKSCFSETSGEDGFRNSNSSQGTVELDSDSIGNNSSSLCQLNEGVDEKALGPKDNILVVAFENSEQNSDEILMRIECKDCLEADSEDNVSLEEEIVGSDKDICEESISMESRQTSVAEGIKKIPDENLLQEESDFRITESAMDKTGEDRESPELGNGPKGDVDICNKSDVDEEDSGQKETKVEEAMEGLDENEKPIENVVSSEEMPEKDIDNDQSLSEMSEDSQEDENEENVHTTSSRGEGEISEDNALSKSQDSSVKYESDSQSCSENPISNVNGSGNVSESPKLLKEDNDVLEKLDQSVESNADKPSQPDDGMDTDDKVSNEVQTNNNEIQSQQNSIISSPSVVNTSNEMNDTIEDSGGIQLAGEEVPLTVLHLEKDLEDYSIQDLLKEAVKAICFSCVYCTHAKKIAVNGKQLAYHLLAEHRFQPIVSSTVRNEESDTDGVETGHICVEKFDDDKPSANDNFAKKDSVSDLTVDQKAVGEFVDMLKNNLSKLENTCFNSDSYDNSDTSASKVFSKTYECFQCRFSTGLHKELYIHNRKMHQKTNLLCIMCKCTFYSYSELLCHLCPGVYVPNERPKFRCCFCSADSLPSAFRFMVHLRKRHHACDVCLEVTGDQQRLSGHVWKHKLNHLCYRCDIAYRNKPDITKHLFWKHGTESVLCKRCLQKKWPHVYHFCVPPAVFTCEECGSTFSRAVALRVHRRLHLGEAPHACPECGQHFISKRLVTRHQELKHSDLTVKQAALSDSENPAVIPKLHPVEGSLDHIDSDHVGDKKELETSLDDASLPDHKSEDNVEKVIATGYPSGSDETSFEHHESNNEDNDAIKKDTKVVAEPSVESQADDPEKEAKPAKKVVDVMDLPPLNLSSESDDSDEENPPSKSETVDVSMENKVDGEEEKQNEVNCSPQREEEEDTKPVEVVDGIWDNFKTYAAGLEVPKSKAGDTVSVFEGGLVSDDIQLVARLIKAEHDYCFPWVGDVGDAWEAEEENTAKVEEESESKLTETTKDKDQEDEFDHNYCSNNSKTDGSEIAQSFDVQEASPKKHPKSPKKRKKTGSGSSSSDASDSSDSDGSSCSCGTNCSCSSGSSSSGSSSSGSGSESSASESGAARTSRREKKKDSKRKRHVASGSRQEDKVGSQGDGEVQSPGSIKDGGTRVDTVMAEEEPPPLREVMIRESDLETDESETDEDFYDEQPRRFHANSSTAANFARLAAGNSPAAVPLDESTLPSPATSVQSPASRPASPTLVLAWRPTQPTPSTRAPPPPPPIPLVEPEVKNSIDIIPEGCTPLIQPKKRGRKRKRPHLPTKLARKQADNVKCSSDPNTVPNLSLKVGKNVRRNKVVPQQSYKNTPPIDVHSLHNSSGAILNSGILHSVSEPSTPASVIEGDDGLRLSKRKRVPKRFYGDSSDEEGESASGNTSAGGGGFSGSSKFSFVVNQSGKIPKKKKSSVGPASSSHYPREPAGRASMDGMSHLQRPAYQYHDDVDDQGISMSSDRDEEESQNGRSEAESDAWSEDDSRNKDGSSCPLPSVSSPRSGNQMPGESVGANTGSLYCYCQCPYDEVSEMIACDGKKCAIEWFHFECVGIMVPPKGKWYCPDCRKRCGSSGRTSDHLSGT